MPLLQLEGVTQRFGGLVAVRQPRFLDRCRFDRCDDRPTARASRRCFNLITGIYTPSAGRIISTGKRSPG